MNNLGEAVSYADLKRRLNVYPTVSDKKVALDETVLISKTAHSSYYDGLSVYALEHTEKCQLMNLGELPAAISFNIVFEGTIDFSICGKPYQLGKNKLNGVECSSYVLNRPELLNRILNVDRTIKHVNVFAEKVWLEKHAKTEQAQQTLRNIFQLHNVVHFWQPSPFMIERAKQLFDTDPAAIQMNVLMKSIALELLSHCIEELDSFAKRVAPCNQSQGSNITDMQLKHDIDAMLLKRFSLEQMAEALDMSISTLQRKFKAKFNITVNHYCRQQRLEIARREMVLNGIAIGEASYLAGYAYPSNFIAAFKKRFNQTPAELLKNIQSD